MRRGWLSMVALCATLSACSGGGGERAGEVELASQTIGPEGGTLELGGGDLAGLRVEVPAQAVTAPTTFTVSEAAAVSDLSPLPPGFAAFSPAIRITASSELTGPVRITFPVNGLPTATDQVLGGFFHDPDASAWTLALPRIATAREVTVESVHLGYWRWGVVLLTSAHGDSLGPALAEWFGPTAYQALREEIDDRYEAIVVDQVAEAIARSDCDQVLAVGNGIGAMADGAEAHLRSLLAGSCGGCDVSMEVFLEELREYLGARLSYGFFELMNENTAIDPFVGLVFQYFTALRFVSVRDSLQCDFDCLFEDPPPGMIGDLATYGVASVSLLFMDMTYRHLACGDPGTASQRILAR